MAQTMQQLEQEALPKVLRMRQRAGLHAAGDAASEAGRAAKHNARSGMPRDL